MSSNHCTFAALFADAASNPFGQGEAKWEKYVRYLHQFRTNQRPLSSKCLLEEAASQLEEPNAGALMIIIEGEEHPTVQCMLGLRKYTRTPDETRESLIGKHYCYYNNVSNTGTGQILELFEDSFNTTPSVTVYKYEHMHQVLTADPAITTVPAAVTEEELERTESVKARHMVFLPPEFVPHVLGKDLSPAAAYQVLYPLMRDSSDGGTPEKCAPVLDLLCASITENAGGLPHGVSTNRLNFCILSNPLILFMERKVLWGALPALAPSATPAVVSGADKAVTRLANVTLQIQEHDKARRAENSTPTLTKLYPKDSLLKKLFALTQVDTEDRVPMVYHALAAAPCRIGTHHTVQNKMEATAVSLGQTAGILQAGLSASFTSLQFQGNNEYEVGNGASPFNIIPSQTFSAVGRGMADATLANNDNLRTLLEGHGVQTWYAINMNRIKAYLPLRYEEALLMLKEFGVLLAMMLGATHVVYLAYNQAVQKVEQRMLTFIWALSETYGERAGPPLLVFFFHFYVRKWFTLQWEANTAIAAPPLVAKIDVFLMDKKIVDLMPPHTQIKELANLSGPATQRPGGNRGGRDDKNNGNSNSNRSRAHSPVSVVENDNLDERFKGRIPFALKVQAGDILTRCRELMEQTPPILCPEVTLGQERCLKWHLKGKCQEDCSRAADHITLQDSDKEEVYKYARSLFA